MRPRQRLEPLFAAADLIRAESGKHVAVFEEFPCRDVRGGGLFNMGTYLLRRHPTTLSLLRAWFASDHHGGERGAAWPARQGAFSHDPKVYAAHAGAVSTFAAGCAAGSPFAPVIAHALGGRINGVYEPDKLSAVQRSGAVVACVREVLVGLRPEGACELCMLLDCEELRRSDAPAPARRRMSAPPFLSAPNLPSPPPSPLPPPPPSQRPCSPRAPWPRQAL